MYIESESGEGLSGILNSINNVIQSLHDLAKHLELRSISISKTSQIKHIDCQDILTIIKSTFSNASIKIIICNGISQFANTEQQNSLILKFVC